MAAREGWVPVIGYKPFRKRKRDRQYRTFLRYLLKHGVEKKKLFQDARAKWVRGYEMCFDLRNGIPILTERELVKGERSVFNQALGELFAFLHGARTKEEFESFGCYWWSPWLTKEMCEPCDLELGDLGPASYGPAWTAFPSPDGPFNQIENLIAQLRQKPYLRTHLLVPWIPSLIARGNDREAKTPVVPCHGFLHLFADEETRELSALHLHRSCDAPVGLAANLIQYSLLLAMLAQVTGYTATEITFVISDGHYYYTSDPERTQVPAIHRMLRTRPQRLPTVSLDPSISDILDFRQKHFTVSDYYPQDSRYRIWTPL